MTAASTAAASTRCPSFSLKAWMGGKAQKAPHILLIDGGVSTHLERGGAFENRALWSASLLLTDSGRKRIFQGHDDWIRYGQCNVVSTVTYQCHYGTYGTYDGGDISHRRRDPVLSPSIMTTLMIDGVQLAKSAVRDYLLSDAQGGRRPLFAIVSSGCYGAALANGSEYTGDYGDVTDQELQEFHKSKLDTYRLQQPDGIAVETIPSFRECECVCKVLTTTDGGSIDNCEHDDAIAIWISFACRNGSDLNDGSQLVGALDILHRYDPDAKRIHGIGLNCCHGAHLKSLVAIVHQHPASRCRTLAVYPNSGESWDAEQGSWQQGTEWGSTAEDFANKLWESVADAAARGMPLILGGCCRTTPEAIAALRKLVDKHARE